MRSRCPTSGWRGALRFVSLLGVASGCGDRDAAPSASASASAPSAPACDQVPAPQQLERCGGGEAVCCDVVQRTTPREAPGWADAMATACGGGSELACQAVRDERDRDAEWKLAAFDRACTRIGRWPCRSALVLTALLHWDRAPKAFENACRQTEDREVQLAKRAFKCPDFARSGFADLKPDLDACLGGSIDRCRAIADADSVTKTLLMEAVFRARGVDPRLGIEAWVQPIFTGDLAPKGRVTVTSEEPSVKAGLAAASDALRVCVADRLAAKARPRGEVELGLAVDRAGKVAYAIEQRSSLEDAILPNCLRRAVQEVEVMPAGPAGRVVVAKLEIAP